MVHSVLPENDINLAKNDLQISKSLVSLCTRNNKQIVVAPYFCRIVVVTALDNYRAR